MQISNEAWNVVFNPHAGSGKARKDKEKILSVLSEAHLNFNIHISEFPGHTTTIARSLISGGARKFIIAGGDGTLNETVNGLADEHGNIPENILVGMIPVGTGNDWIKTFGIPDDYKKAMQIILAGRTTRQDIGIISYKIDNKEKTRYFVNMAGFGFDGLVTQKANQLKAKGVSGFSVYAGSLFSSYLKFHSQRTIIDIDGEKIEKDLYSASIGIGKYIGGGMMQVPDANPVKGIFHITLINNIGLPGILRNFKGLYSGKFIKDRRVSTYTGKEIYIKSSVPLPGEADGESLGESDFRISILPQKLTVICGKTDF